MDCRVASLLAETVARLGEFHSVIANSTLSFRTPHRLCEPHPVIPNPTPSLRAQRSNPPHRQRGAQPWTATSLRSSQRQWRVFANPTPSLRAPPHHCEHHPVFANPTPSLRAQRSNPPHRQRGAQTMDCHGLKASQRRVLIDCRVASLLAETAL